MYKPTSDLNPLWSLRHVQGHSVHNLNRSAICQNPCIEVNTYILTIQFLRII